MSRDFGHPRRHILLRPSAPQFPLRAVIVRADPFPGRDFTGKVTRMAKLMGQSKISQRGPRRPNDLDALEVMIELDTADLLLPGMRVDVLFKPDATAEKPSTTAATPETKTGDKPATTKQ